MSKASKAAQFLKGKATQGTNYIGTRRVAGDNALEIGTDIAIDSGIGATKLASKAFVRKTDKSIYNGYTGLKTTGFATAAAFAGSALWGKTTYEGTKDQRAMETVQADYVGNAPMLNYDGVGNAPTLGASGNMVFGLHNSRRG